MNLFSKNLNFNKENILYNIPDGVDCFAVLDLLKYFNNTLVILRDDVRLERFSKSLKIIDNEINIIEFPAWDCLPFDKNSPNQKIIGKRVKALFNLLNVNKQIFINPKIKSASKELTNFWHGCLSAKGQFRGQVATYKSITYESMDENLNTVSGKLDGMAAVIFQHEFRHLLSNLYVDYACKLLDTEDLNADLENGNYDDLDDCDSSIPHLLSDYKVGTII